MSIVLRQVTPADEEFLYAVYAGTRTDELAQVGWNAEQLQAFLRMQFNAQAKYYLENYPGAVFQIILVGGQPAGRLYLHRRAEEIRIMDIALLSEFRGHGVGSALLNQTMQEARAASLPLTIHVERMNPALRLYERLGFYLKEDKGVYLLMEWKSPVAEQTVHVG